MNAAFAALWKWVAIWVVRADFHGRLHRNSMIINHYLYAMKIATWNVNSLKVRLPQVLDWLTTNPVDVLCLQELKLADEYFPLDAFTQLGYHAVWAGQKTYNGVAIISRVAGQDVVRGIPGFDDPQQRIVAVTVPSPAGDIQAGVRIICAYCPNGQDPASDKYAYKLTWFSALREWLRAELVNCPRLAVLGDYNVAPAEADVHDKWTGQILVSEPERQAFEALLDLGLQDAFRLFEQAAQSFSWWDYRQFSFRRNLGLRIDHILLSAPLAQVCHRCVIDPAPRANPQPSDHAPVIATLALT